MNTKSANIPSQRILWLDLEMTGLDARRDVILEVAAIVTDWDFNEIATFEGIVRHDGDRLTALMGGNAAFWNANPKARDGLITQNAGGKPNGEVEEDLLAFLDANFSSDKPILLAGNSIHMDRRFITEQWPRFDARLHYRMLDVSAWKIVYNAKFGKYFTKPENHRALDDIRGSIDELKYYLTKVTP